MCDEIKYINIRERSKLKLLLAYIRENGIPINIIHGSNDEIADWLEETANLLEMVEKEDE